MGKYKISNLEIDTDKEALTWIANELAEGNRLTILKMKINQGLITERQEMRDQLVDKT